MPEYPMDEILQSADEPEIIRFVNAVYSLHRQGREDRAIDQIIAFFDDALIAGDTVKCRAALQRIMLARLALL